MVMQWKPLAGEEASRRYYSPSRDIGQIGPDLMRASMHALDEQFWEPWFVEYMAAQGITYEDLTAAAKLLGDAFNMIIREANPVVAMDASGFARVSPAIQTAFYTKIGQVFMAAVWAGVKDLAVSDDAPPATFNDMMTQIDGGFSDLLNGTATNTIGPDCDDATVVTPGEDDPGPPAGP